MKNWKPTVLWFTGLSGSGKSTISEELYKLMKSEGLEVEHLDGDVIRDIFPKTGFSKADRNAHVKRVGYLASRLQAHKVFVIGSFVSPYKEARDFVREICEDFTEIYISTPFEECERRDVKGLYAKARSGEIKNFTGLDDPYEAPENPELEIDTTDISLSEALNQITEYLDNHKSN
ncbi:MAG: adenylyl-sulfate kinase [Balneola sp.]|nr:adenylyl-sulfate kinase [Balneola sp.]MBO6649894.1 adenylyl-sulfate kinase [Balneola sp.]MBO6711759.1 adenylyl-sulfate kinase [Balneola sp.]MBO6799953.1 adenylyl-sulfate kinase [Balneola sp.]MBO6871198.1 adenylyl-sulfate kinase [Balneola sp.]